MRAKKLTFAGKLDTLLPEGTEKWTTSKPFQTIQLGKTLLNRYLFCSGWRLLQDSLRFQWSLLDRIWRRWVHCSESTICQLFGSGWRHDLVKRHRRFLGKSTSTVVKRQHWNLTFTLRACTATKTIHFWGKSRSTQGAACQTPRRSPRALGGLPTIALQQYAIHRRPCTKTSTKSDRSAMQLSSGTYPKEFPRLHK